ncbi:MAG TPA: hypothetical protein DCQ84_07800 [Candidatus Competibacteraceae bacterium]|nr:hypothetical protein [Candidatus Competibacteraceae bacterium]
MRTLLEIDVAGDSAAIAAAKDAVEAFCAQRGLPPRIAPRLSLALDELFANILSHGCAATGVVPVIRLRVGLENGHLVTELSDSGPPFNPLAAPSPALDLDLDARSVGGLGIHLVRRLMDAVRYRRHGGYNRLTLRQTLHKAE